MEKFKKFLNTDPKLRTFTAIIMFAVVFAAYKIGFWGINGLIIAITSAMIYEYDKMFNKKLGLSFLIDELVIVGSLLYFVLNKKNIIIYDSHLYKTFATLLIYFCIKLISNSMLNKKRWFLESLQPVYIGIGSFSVLVLYNTNIPALIYAFIITITTDTSAFFIGRKLKGPKLCPKISPNKTISGALGGFITTYAISTTIIILYSLKNKVDDNKFIYFMAVANIFLPIISQLGDLFESHIKRLNNVKDTSNLLPGHGGLLDRFDSILFIAPSVLSTLILFVIFIFRVF